MAYEAAVGTVREVTDAEAEAYRTNGSVKLEQLVDADVAGQLLRAARDAMGERPEAAGDVQMAGRSTATVQLSRHDGCAPVGFHQRLHAR